MKRSLIPFALALGAAAIGLLAGCGDDEPTKPDLKTGDLNDPEFQMVQAFVDEADFGGMTGFLTGFTFEVMDTVLLEGTPRTWQRENYLPQALQDSVLLAYHANTNYWYLYMADTSAEMDGLIEDSVQFLHATGPVQWPDSNLLVGVNTGVHVRFIFTQDTVTFGQRFSIMGELLDRGDVTVSGTQGFSFALGGLAKQTTECEVAFSGSSTMQNVVLNMTDVFEGYGCPTAGSLSYAFDLHVACTGDTTFTTDGFWRMAQTFHGETSTVVFENNTTRWTYTDTCGLNVKAPGRFDELLNRQY